jgi:hypothetical protein
LFLIAVCVYPFVIILNAIDISENSSKTYQMPLLNFKRFKEDIIKVVAEALEATCMHPTQFIAPIAVESPCSETEGLETNSGTDH